MTAVPGYRCRQASEALSNLEALLCLLVGLPLKGGVVNPAVTLTLTVVCLLGKPASPHYDVLF